MSDRDWREAERAWQADPQDRTKHEAAIAARRRAGVPVSGPLLEDHVLPPTTLELPQGLEVLRLHVLTVERQIQTLPVGTETLPAHRAWWVNGYPPAELLDQAEELQLPGLEYLGPNPEQAWERIGRMDHLRWLGCMYLQDPAILRHLPRNLVRLVVLGCFAERPDWTDSLPPLPHLTEVYVSHPDSEVFTLEGLTRLPSLRRLFVEDPANLRSAMHEVLPACRLGATVLL